MPFYPRVAQRLRAEQVATLADQGVGGVRQAVAELAENVLPGSHDIDAAGLSVLGDGPGEFGK